MFEGEPLKYDLSHIEEVPRLMNSQVNGCCFNVFFWVQSECQGEEIVKTGESDLVYLSDHDMCKNMNIMQSIGEQIRTNIENHVIRAIYSLILH